jgi:hypothetical protein
MLFLRAFALVRNGKGKGVFKPPSWLRERKIRTVGNGRKHSFFRVKIDPASGMTTVLFWRMMRGNANPFAREEFG